MVLAPLRTVTGSVELNIRYKAMTDWKRKLAAYLHDPPEKAYDFGPAHHAAARSHAASFGVAELWDALSHNPDWSAAAADRFVLPDGRREGVGGLGEEGRTVFVHPMSGRTAGEPAWKGAGFPSAADATQWLGDIRPDWKNDDPQTLFLKAWGLWMNYAASHDSGHGKGAETLPYLPADTRVPDASIWHHCAIVSAIERTRPEGNPKALPRPAFLLFQVGPVQDFIAQARSTRDLRNGSYLLSWLMMHAIKAVADECGPDALIFPSLRGQPIYEWLERRLQLDPLPESALTPGIPNRFLALVPDNFDAKLVEAAFKKEWQEIASECAAWLKKKGVDVDSNPLWKEQIDQHWQITWRLQPWQTADAALDAFKHLPLGRDNAIHLAKEIALAIPEPHQDDRCYRGGKLDPGWAWSAHYQLCQHALDARRNLRDFEPPAFDATRKPAHRDAFSGRDEAVIEEAQLEALAERSDTGHLFRHSDPLGAANLIKRIWHKAYLARLNEVAGKNHLRRFERACESFDSVPSVAAGAFAHRLHREAANDGPLRERWLAFARAASEAREDFPDSVASFVGTSEAQWHELSDRSIFFPDVWQREQSRRKVSAPHEFFHQPAARDRLAKAGTALRALLAEAKRSPSSYYAVVALDGDQIGKWLSGEKTPAVGNVMSPKAATYFRETMLPAMTADEKRRFAEALRQLATEKTIPKKPEGWDEVWPPASPDAWIRAWLDSPRPLSPSWHLQFSEALANFGLHAARRIVEETHHGQLIYSGGDDVLAMLPAENAITCARDLRAAFQGRRAQMSAEAQDLFKSGVPEGFLQVADPSPKEPTWPLLMPGDRMTVSVGLAIGHVKEPLQDMIQEAQRAEKRAKADPQRITWNKERTSQEWKLNEGWGRDALALTLFKRSGETIRWGAKFDSAAFPLLSYIQRHYRQPWDQPEAERPIRSRFPYRLAQLLGVYDTHEPLNEELRQIAEKEIAHVISRQTGDDETGQSVFSRAELERLCAEYLKELRSFTWDQPDEHGTPRKDTSAPRPLREFIHLFLTEAFIRRQAD